MITMTSAEAQNSFGKLLDTAQREPVAITRHGRAAAFLVSLQDVNDLLDAKERRRQAAAELEAWFKEAEKTMTPEAASLTVEDINQMVHELH